jgi:hypothetical protein
MSGKCSSRSLPSADEAQKERRTTYKAQTYKATTYAGRFPGIALQDALHQALHTQPTCNDIQETHSRNTLTLNTLRKRQFGSQRRPGEFSRTESPTRQGGTPVYPEASVSSRDQPAGMISAEMIVMVVQPHPLRRRVARWHGVPGGAGLLPADVSPLSGDIIFYSLVAYPMGAGWIRMAPGKKAEKDGERPKLKNVVVIWLRCGIGGVALSSFFQWAMPRMIVLKTGRTISSPASPEATGTTLTLSGTLLFSPLFGASPRHVPILSEEIAL